MTFYNGSVKYVDINHLAHLVDTVIITIVI